MDMDKAVLNDGERWPSLRYNRRGELVFSLFDVKKQLLKTELRGVVAIRLDPAPKKRQ